MNCSAPKCDKVAVYEIRLPSTATPERLCLKHGGDRKLELDAALVTYQVISIGPRPKTDAEALAELRAAPEASRIMQHRFGGPANPMQQPPGPVPAAAAAIVAGAAVGTNDQIELLQQVQVSQRKALERQGAELEQSNADRVLLIKRLEGVTIERAELITQVGDAKHECQRLAGLLASANQRLQSFEVEPLPGVDRASDTDRPPAKAGSDATTKPDVLGAPLPPGHVVGNHPPAKPAV